MIGDLWCTILNNDTKLLLDDIWLFYIFPFAKIDIIRDKHHVQDNFVCAD